MTVAHQPMELSALHRGDEILHRLADEARLTITTTTGVAPRGRVMTGVSQGAG
jgi:hypothetical protein